MQTTDWAAQIERAGFIVKLEPEYEDIRVRGNAIASGDDEEDRRVENEILARLDRGDIWAWCVAGVFVSHPSKPDVTGFASLGCCNYESAEDFKRSGYYDDLAREALADWIEQVDNSEEAERAIETARTLI